MLALTSTMASDPTRLQTTQPQRSRKSPKYSCPVLRADLVCALFASLSMAYPLIGQDLNICGCVQYAFSAYILRLSAARIDLAGQRDERDISRFPQSVRYAIRRCDHPLRAPFPLWRLPLYPHSHVGERRRARLLHRAEPERGRPPAGRSDGAPLDPLRPVLGLRRAHRSEPVPAAQCLAGRAPDVGQRQAGGPDRPARDRIRRDNLPILVREAKAAALVVACWGAGAWDPESVDRMLGAIAAGEAPWPDVHCFGLTAGGAPIHPMARGRWRIPDHAKPMLWNVGTPIGDLPWVSASAGAPLATLRSAPAGIG